MEMHRDALALRNCFRFLNVLIAPMTHSRIQGNRLKPDFSARFPQQRARTLHEMSSVNARSSVRTML